jgi:hypothetical protein
MSKSILDFGLLKKKCPLGKTITDSFELCNNGNSDAPFFIETTSTTIVSLSCEPAKGILRKVRTKFCPVKAFAAPKLENSSVFGSQVSNKS